MKPDTIPKYEFMAIIASHTDQQLKDKLTLGGILVNGLLNDRNPRAAVAAERLTMEMGWIAEEQQRRRQSPNGSDKAAPQIIGLKTAATNAKAADLGKPPAQVVKLKTLDLKIKQPRFYRGGIE